ncbi:MAG: hypothetical protein JWM62_3020, partial [Frankiales bacterium]|nr:hypothetical protein [Frankiales bacterium]
MLSSREVTGASSFGLITELPPLIWVVWLLLVTHFVACIRRSHPPAAPLVAGLAAWAVTLHAAPVLLEP